MPLGSSSEAPVTIPGPSFPRPRNSLDISLKGSGTADFGDRDFPAAPIIDCTAILREATRTWDGVAMLWKLNDSIWMPMILTPAEVVPFLQGRYKFGQIGRA